MKIDFASGQFQAMQLAICALAATAPEKELVLKVLEHLVTEAVVELGEDPGAADYSLGANAFVDSMRAAITLKESPGPGIPFKLQAVPKSDEPE